jgi:hypothetical protein
VEGQIRLSCLEGQIRLNGVGDCLEVKLQIGEIGRGHPIGGHPAHHGLEHDANGNPLRDINRALARHGRVLIGRAHYQAGLLQLQRLTESVLAYAQLPGNRNLTQGIAGLISPSHYDVPQGGEDLRAKRLGLELLKIGGDCTRSHYR